MSFSTPTIANEVSWATSDALSAGNLNDHFGPLKTWTEVIDGLTRVAPTTFPYTIQQNTEVVVYVDASSGDKTVNLPAATGQYQSIVIKKTDATYNTVTIARAGSDTIESLTTNNVSPSGTSLDIKTPDASITLVPNGTTWRIENLYRKRNIAFSGYANTNQALTVSQQLVNLNAEEYDTNSNFNTTLSKFVAPVAGLYEVSGNARVTSINSSTSLVFYFAKNGAIYKRAQGYTNPPSVGDQFLSFANVHIELAANDEVTLYCWLFAGTATIVGDSTSTYMNGRLLY